MTLIFVTGSVTPFPLPAEARRHHITQGPVFTRETIKAPADMKALLKQALARKEDKLVIAQIIAERLGKEDRARWALAMAVQASKKLKSEEVRELISLSCMVYGGFYEPQDAEHFRKLRVATMTKLQSGRSGDPHLRKLASAVGYFLAKVQQVMAGAPLQDVFDPECLVFLVARFQARRDSVYPIDKMLYKGVALIYKSRETHGQCLQP